MTTRCHDERGFSMVELLVVLILMGIIGAMTTGFLVSSATVTARAESSEQAGNGARLALRSMLEDLRAAQAVAVPTSTTACPPGATGTAVFANCLQFTVIHSSTGSSYPQNVITYGLRSDGTIREDEIFYTSSTSSTSFTGKVVLGKVTNGASAPLFTYYDHFGNPLSAASNSVGDYAIAGFIKVSINVSYQSNAPAVSVFSTAALRNNR